MKVEVAVLGLKTVKCCFTSTEARWLIRTGGGGGGGGGGDVRALGLWACP